MREVLDLFTSLFVVVMPLFLLAVPGAVLVAGLLAPLLLAALVPLVLVAAAAAPVVAVRRLRRPNGVRSRPPLGERQQHHGRRGHPEPGGLGW
jgi:hypothetical protein